MQLYRFEIKPPDLEAATQLIETHGGEILFSSEGDEFAEIYAHIPAGVVLNDLKGVPAELPSIDWEGQWALHGVKELNIIDKMIKLVSGPGFGDFSHPTTQLMIELMKEHLRGDVVIDIGCGSGILSMAAVALGAKWVIGIDIDAEALEHSRENAKANGFEERCEFCLPEEFGFEGEAFVLMNMITSEQKEAWREGIKAVGMITSGVLREEREKYLKWLRGWRVIEEREKEGWLGFYLTKE